MQIEGRLAVFVRDFMPLGSVGKQNQQVGARQGVAYRPHGDDGSGGTLFLCCCGYGEADFRFVDQLILGRFPAELPGFAQDDRNTVPATFHEVLSVL